MYGRREFLSEIYPRTGISCLWISSHNGSTFGNLHFRFSPAYYVGFVVVSLGGGLYMLSDVAFVYDSVGALQ